MKLFLAKLGFVHRRLWQRNGTYRAAVLFGPPPLLGAMAAALIWAGMQAWSASRPAAPLPAWATVAGPRPAASTEAPRAVAPGAELPASGMPAGSVPGWQGGIQPVEVSAALDANVLPTRLASFAVDTPSLDLGRILAAGPATERFVGVGTAVLVVSMAGTYELTLRTQLTKADHATCLQRLVFGGQRVVSTIQLDRSGPGTLNFEPASFMLQPGLYPIAVLFGCWRGEQSGGAAGTLSVLIRHPGDQDLRPARSDEILRMAPRSP